MAKRVIDDSTLSPIADLVRSIMGLSDMLLLTPIDMASHLEDADGVVTNQEALIAELQELLEGKAGITGVKAAFGTYIPASNYAPNATNFGFAHNLGVVPDIVVVWANNTDSVQGEVMINIIERESGTENYEFFVGYRSATYSIKGYFNPTLRLNNSSQSYLDETTVKRLYADGDEIFIAGNVYNWIVFAGVIE